MNLPATIDEVIATLDVIIAENTEKNNPAAFFAFVYRRTTLEIKRGIEKSFFQDNERMEKMDVYFANLYIQAYWNYSSGKVVSESWKTAFDACQDPLTIMQYIMLGMNAHINLDLGISAAHMSEGKNIEDLKTDFQRVNTILFSLTNEMQKGLSRVSRFMKLLDKIGGKFDEQFINFSIEKAREVSWISATAIWKAITPEEKEKVIRDIDHKTSSLGQLMAHPGKGIYTSLIIWIVRIFEEKDVKKVIDAMQQVNFSLV